VHGCQQKRYPVHRIVTTFDPLDAEIFIESDTDLESYGFLGNGSVNNPYRREIRKAILRYLFQLLKLN